MVAVREHVSSKRQGKERSRVMGMAASQARFLGLTARKTNVEYEGQQVNQQRTALANQSANYYNDLLGMTVPVPPSVDSYTKTVYTFEDGALTNQITALIAQADGKYTVSYLSHWQDDFAPVAASSSIVTKVGGEYSIGANKLRKLGDPDPALADNADLQKKKQEEEKAWGALLEAKYGTAADQWLVRYVTDTTTGKETPYFYKKADCDAATYDANGNSLSNINCYTIGSDKKTEEHKAIEDCQVEKDTSGRFISISIPDGDGNMVTYSLTTSTETDQDMYNDAMNQYEHEKYLYDQAIQDINAKIEIIQAEDKNLELRLKQLDTEQDAISTEMDAVSKVIEKNTESTFKTFG